jgi:hypothetical protein
MSDEKLPHPNDIQPDQSHGDVVPEGSPENAQLTEAVADKPLGKMYFRYDPDNVDALVDEITKAAQDQYDRAVAKMAAKKTQNSDARTESKDER